MYTHREGEYSNTEIEDIETMSDFSLEGKESNRKLPFSGTAIHLLSHSA